ncbi:unnamed protein product [Prunus brigantina]
MSRGGYVRTMDILLQTMPEEDIDRSTLWRKGHEAKNGKFPDEKIAEKAIIIDDLKKQVLEGSLTVSGSNDILTMALGSPEHSGRVRGVGAYVNPSSYFNEPV